VLENEVTGILVPPGNPEALATGLIRLLRDPSLCQRLANAALSAYERSFTARSMAERYAELYGRMVTRH
jgi:glycosyltransferase involved in cell wall biosynthesis